MTNPMLEHYADNEIVQYVDRELPEVENLCLRIERRIEEADEVTELEYKIDDLKDQIDAIESENEGLQDIISAIEKAVADKPEGGVEGIRKILQTR